MYSDRGQKVQLRPRSATSIELIHRSATSYERSNEFSNPSPFEQYCGVWTAWVDLVTTISTGSTSLLVQYIPYSNSKFLLVHCATILVAFRRIR
jgi:hypothetical protein